MKVSASIFDRNGLAALRDLATDEWKTIFTTLEKEQQWFLGQEKLFKGGEYAWPNDPLHTWSRVWEYPYITHHLRWLKRRFSRTKSPVVLDVGCGVTFFPFTVAKQGFNVRCIDNDPVCEADMNKAIQLLATPREKITFRRSNGNALPVRDASVHIVYSISVLEHVDKVEDLIDEISRVLVRGGFFLLTFDLDLLGNFELSVEHFKDLRSHLAKYFDAYYPDVTVHPADVLFSEAGPYPLKNLDGASVPWFLAKQMVKAVIGRKRHPLPQRYHLAVNGMVLQKRVSGK